jgi:hypothetical protein
MPQSSPLRPILPLPFLEWLFFTYFIEQGSGEQLISIAPDLFGPSM